MAVGEFILELDGCRHQFCSLRGEEAWSSLRHWHARAWNLVPSLISSLTLILLCVPPSFLCSIYAHGGWITSALLLSSVAGVVCTIYSAASCRFVLVSFLSERGNFDTLFSTQGAGDGFVPFQTGAGLYSWLDPGDSRDQGTCIGYKRSALNVIADPTFEAVRCLSVIAIILGLGVFVWIFSLACLSLGHKQVYLLAACQLLLVILVSLTFLILQSDLCEKVGQNTTCAIDEGAMVAIAAAIAWSCGFLITVFFMKSPEKQRQEREEEIQRRAEELAEKKRRKRVLKRKQKEEKAKELAIIEQEMMEQERAMAYRSTVDHKTPGTPVTIASGGGDDNLELYLTRSLDRIQSLMLDDDDDDYI